MSELKPLIESLDYIQFHFTTVFGDLKSVEFPSRIWDEMYEGTGVDGSSLGFLTTEQSDMRVKPDHATFAILPWSSRVGRFICDTTTNDGEPHSLCPRSLLKREISKAVEMGLGYRTRPELEWYFVTGKGDPADNGGYMDTVPHDKFYFLRRVIIDDLLEMGAGVKTIHHENGPAQQEFEFTPADALTQADNTQTARMVIKTECAMEDIIGSLMPKPFPEVAGSGLHIHQYLTRDGENIFSDPEKGISDFLIHFVGGIMEHCNAMTAVLNPLTNSYKRLVPGHEAPVYKSWGVGNRTALIRVPGYERSARIEYRAADGGTNIYLASALLLAAGLEGVKKKTEPNTATRENIEKMTPKRRKELGITQLPENLGEALDAMESSSFMKKVLGSDLFDLWVEKKRGEYAEYLDAERLGETEALSWELKHYLRRT